MSIRAIPRSAVDGAVKLTRMPLDIVVSLLPGDGSSGGPGPSAGIALDRLEATVRDVAGMALGDDEMRADADRRRIAADERAQALRQRDDGDGDRDGDGLSTQADTRNSTRIDDSANRGAKTGGRRGETENHRDKPENRRDESEQSAEQERAGADRPEEERRSTAAGTEQPRTAASRKVRTRTTGSTKEDSDKARLERLEAEAKALEEREAALSSQAATQHPQDESTETTTAGEDR
ncbi:MAG: hypothetical protein Q8O56_15715 [Solirubrobacteraceae bacterium]|nr:hypothetical protein [Solirubrobacteraceae bacterium]